MIPFKAMVWLAVAAVVISIAAAIFHFGQEDALEDVRKQNEKSGKASDAAVLDYDECDRAGRMWDYRARKCGRIAPISGN